MMNKSSLIVYLKNLSSITLKIKKKMFAIPMRNTENISNTRSSTDEKLKMLQTESVSG